MALDQVVRDLHKFNLFQSLSEESLKDIAPYFKKQTLKRGEIVYSSYDTAHHFIFVISGKIKIFRLSSLGKEQIIRVIKPKEFTGELALFEGIRKAYASSLTKSEIYLVEHQDFKNILAKYPDVSFKMIEILTTRLHLSEEQTSLLATHTAKDRLWIYLYKEAKEVDGKTIVYYQQTKRFIAAYLGMTSETLSRVLHQLEQEDLITEYPDQYIVIHKTG